MLKYSISTINQIGIGIKLEQGSARDLYHEVIGKLAELYQDRGYNVTVPETPNFDAFGNGKRMLESLILEKEVSGRHHDSGKVNVTYFQSGKKARPVKNVDYAASSTFGYGNIDKKEFLSLFFNTRPPRIENADLEWANQAQRDQFIQYLEGRDK